MDDDPKELDDNKLINNFNDNKEVDLLNINNNNFNKSFPSRMQPTLPQSTGAADMDSLPAVQSMDWLFKKERIYLLAQFWQQVS